MGELYLVDGVNDMQRSLDHCLAGTEWDNTISLLFHCHIVDGMQGCMKGVTSGQQTSGGYSSLCLSSSLLAWACSVALELSLGSRVPCRTGITAEHTCLHLLAAD